jgi:hypothetical protein
MIFTHQSMRTNYINRFIRGPIDIKKKEEAGVHM